MNLVQVQEHLKGMPTQVIMGYANGQNPQVPPYIALGELNRRKQMEQQPAQAPQGSVKEQIEQSLMQPQQLPGLAAQGVPVPQPPQPQGMPAQMPKQLAGPAPQQAPTQMAAGGLASVPMRKEMFNYAPGGIVAFANEENDQVVYDEETQKRGEEELERMRMAENKPRSAGVASLSPSAMANKILMDQMAGKTRMEEPEDPEITRARLAEKFPILKTLPGAQAEALATKLEAYDAAQKAKFQESEGVRGLAGLSNALIAAGEATRGRKGSGIGDAFGGFGKAYNAETAAKEERAAKQELLERGRLVDTSKIRSDVEALQRAQAEGRVGEAMKYKEALNKQIADVERIQGSAAAAALKNQIDLATLEATKAHYKASEGKPSQFAEQWAAMQANPDLFEKWQGVNKTGAFTLEDAIKSVNSNDLTKYKPQADREQLAFELFTSMNAKLKAQDASNKNAPNKTGAKPSDAPPGYDPSKVRLKGG